ncbi:hypothetical protein JD844_000151 [Phrynosoma platyrhinos]|uniref:Hydroxysteroid dehydrogenase-like protein 1 n=1 Tax=Phrynosoma platyrhinos TaxID=52577 RepID=A0ABQ7SQB2_PHRPL|nr:hypothetical protein JD844_000151 [Phrynosoma platyrhinos]
MERHVLEKGEIGRSCSCFIETLALIGAFYTAKTCFTILSDTYTLIRVHFIPRLVKRADLVKLYGKWAIVTGCTSGVGKAYAKELASHGVNIILISRNKEKLEAVAKELVDSYKIETAVIVADFSKGREIYSVIEKALMGKEIGILVNNAGVFYPHLDCFTSLTKPNIWELIDVNIGAASMMLHMVLPGMDYLDYLSQALYYEYAPKGIFVQTLLPGFVSTKMIKFIDVFSKESFLSPSAEEYVHHAITTLGISRRTTGYWPHTILLMLGNYVPEWLWAWGMNRAAAYLHGTKTL